MEQKKWKEVVEKVWPKTKKDLEKAREQTQKMIAQGEKQLQSMTERGIEKTQQLSESLKREKAYYTLGKTVAHLPKSRWGQTKKVTDLVDDIKKMTKEIEKKKKK
ncbi:MAG: hypothetical protein GF333_00880 [Candidatus Omnitrophica bacterium]|nr:hypothetical protein [Candidatus Omnitrophota bacterium]